MTSAGPCFLDEDEPVGTPALPVASENKGEPGELSPLPRGPMLLAADTDGLARVDVGWMPETVATPRAHQDRLSWLVLSAISFVLMLLQQSRGLGGVLLVAIAGGPP